MIESNNDDAKILLHHSDGGSGDSANGTASSPSPSSMRCDQDSDTLKENMSSTPTSSCAGDLVPSHSPIYDNIKKTAANKRALAKSNASNTAKQSSVKGEKTGKKVSESGGGANANANQDDPSRQIKFYDDYIDFRGDILRRPPGAKNCRILWEYLFTLLQDTSYSSIIRWEDRTQMVFRIIQAEKLAALWGLQKNRLGMTYEKLSRGMRYYYPNNIIAREPGRRLLYRFMRHPDEIKKFVKKNGTYMLKRAKSDKKKAGAGGDDSDREDGFDEDSGLDEPAPSVSPNDCEKVVGVKDEQVSVVEKNVQHSLANAASANVSQFYSNFNFLTQIAAVAAQMPASYYPRSEEESVAHFLMQLKNHKSLSETVPHQQQQLQSDINASPLHHIQQIYSNSFHNQLLSGYGVVKSEDCSGVGSDSESCRKERKQMGRKVVDVSVSELPLNLSTSSLKKLQIKREKLEADGAEMSGGDDEENFSSSSPIIKSNCNQIMFKVKQELKE